MTKQREQEVGRGTYGSVDKKNASDKYFEIRPKVVGIKVGFENTTPVYCITLIHS